MRKIAHISDIHFGKADRTIVDRLVDSVHVLKPDVVVISGDLTQRARKTQFAEARAFLDRLPLPQIVVPGNHDVPLYNVYHRFARPLDNYKKYITHDLTPFFSDEEIAVAGINTARSMTFKNGRVSNKHAASLSERFKPLDAAIAKIVVMHHPLDVPVGSKHRIVNRAEEILPKIALSGADIFLSGHLHVSRITSSAHRYQLQDGKEVLIIQAGTAASTRGRGEPNSFNFIEIDGSALTVERFECVYPADGFVPVSIERFVRVTEGWSVG